VSEKSTGAATGQMLAVPGDALIRRRCAEMVLGRTVQRHETANNS
jgi:hypothetical protein